MFFNALKFRILNLKLLYKNQRCNKGNTKKLHYNGKNITKCLQGNVKYITFVSVKETNTKTNDSNESTSW